MLLLIALFFSPMVISAQIKYAGSESKLFDDNVIHRIEIQFESQNYQTKLDSYKSKKETEKKYLLGNIVIDGNAISNVGVRYKGESSYIFNTTEKKSFKIDLDEFVLDKKYQKIEKFSLNANFKDPTQIREKLYLDMLKDLNQPYQKNAFAEVYVNGKYLGLYLLLEEIGKKFLERNFDTSNGTFVKGDPKATLSFIDSDIGKYRSNYTLENKKNQIKHWKKLINFLKKINQDQVSESDYYMYLNNNFNIESCLTQWAVNNFSMNLDTYNMGHNHNFYLFFNKESNKIEWISFDGNYAFGGWGENYTLPQLISFPVFANREIDKYEPFAIKLHENQFTKKIYKNIIIGTMIPKFTMKYFNNKIDGYKSLITESVKKENYSNYTFEEFEKSYEYDLGDINDAGTFSSGLKPFIEKRIIAIKSQLSIPLQ